MFAFEEAGYDVSGDGSESSNARPRLKRSRSSEDLRQQQEIDLAEEIEIEFRNHALNSGSIWDKVLYWGGYAVDSLDGTSASSILQARLSTRRAFKDAPKVVQEGAGILFDMASGRSVDDSRLEAYSELINSWGPNATGFLAGFVGGKGGKRPTAPKFNRKINRQHFQEHHIISNKSSATANHPLWSMAGMDPNDRANRMFLPTVEGAKISTTRRSIHQGRHDAHLNKTFKDQMDVIRNLGLRESWSQSQYESSLRELISRERQQLKSGQRKLNKNKRDWSSQ